MSTYDGEDVIAGAIASVDQLQGSFYAMLHEEDHKHGMGDRYSSIETVLNGLAVTRRALTDLDRDLRWPDPYGEEAMEPKPDDGSE